MSDQIAKGEEFEKKAEKKIKGWGLFGSKYEDAAELYEKSANSFKLAKSWDRAGSVFIKLANCRLKADSKHEAATAYASAANCYKKTSNKDAISCLDQAVNIFLDIGRHNMAAKHCKEIGELYEPEHNIEKAIVYFERAAELFEHEATTSANQCKQKVAEFSAQLEQYQKAIVIYEEIARQSINNNLLKYGVRGHLLNAGLCQLCRGDIVAITNALERYQDLDPTFSRTRFRYMQQGAEAVHAANPDVLVILSGLSYDIDLSFLGNRSVNLSFTNKLVFETHRYKFSNTATWADHSANEACRIVRDDMTSKSGFLLDKGFPLFVSEFGIDESANDATDESFMNCFLSYAAEHDFDWAIWALTGSYYIRQGKTNTEETYGLLNFDWSDVRNPRLLRKISTIQSPFKGPGLRGTNTEQLTNTAQLIFHPSTGLCVMRRSVFELIRRSVFAPLTLGPCTHPKALWSYTPKKTITLYEADFCIQAEGPGKPGKLRNMCIDPDTKWEAISDSKLHLSSTVGDGKTVCLDVDFHTNNVVTNWCKCVSDDKTCDPSSQWFKLIKI